MGATQDVNKPHTFKCPVCGYERFYMQGWEAEAARKNHDLGVCAATFAFTITADAARAITREGR